MPMHDFASIAREFSLTLMSVSSWDLVFISLAIEISEALSFSFRVRTVSLISCTSATILQKQNNRINNQFSDLSVSGTMQIYTTTIIVTAKKTIFYKLYSILKWGENGEAKNRKRYLLDSLYFYCQHSGTWLRGCVLSGSIRKGFLYELRRQQPGHWLTWMSNTLSWWDWGEALFLTATGCKARPTFSPYIPRPQGPSSSYQPTILILWRLTMSA